MICLNRDMPRMPTLAEHRRALLGSALAELQDRQRSRALSIALFAGLAAVAVWFGFDLSAAIWGLMVAVDSWFYWRLWRMKRQLQERINHVA